MNLITILDIRITINTLRILRDPKIFLPQNPQIFAEKFAAVMPHESKYNSRHSNYDKYSAVLSGFCGNQNISPADPANFRRKIRRCAFNLDSQITNYDSQFSNYNPRLTKYHSLLTKKSFR